MGLQAVSKDELDILYETHLLEDHKFTVSSERQVTISRTTKIELNMLSDPSMPWYECGSHKCLVCDGDIYLGSLEKHLMSAHKIGLAEYRVIFELKERSSVFAIPDFQCLVCEGAVTHTLSHIKSHLWVRHNMPMEDYFFKYVKDQSVQDLSAQANQGGGDEGARRELKEILEFCFQNILKRMNSSAPDTKSVGRDVEFVVDSAEAEFGESEITAENDRSDLTVSHDERGIVEQCEGNSQQFGGAAVASDELDENENENSDAVEEATVENIENGDLGGEEEEEAQEDVDGNSEEFQLDANKLGERFIVKRTSDFPDNDGFTWKLVGKHKQQYFFRKFACKRENCEGLKKIRMFGNNKRRCSTPNHKMEVIYMKMHSCQNGE